MGTMRDCHHGWAPREADRHSAARICPLSALSVHHLATTTPGPHRETQWQCVRCSDSIERDSHREVRNFTRMQTPYLDCEIQDDGHLELLYVQTAL